MFENTQGAEFHPELNTEKFDAVFTKGGDPQGRQLQCFFLIMATLTKPALMITSNKRVSKKFMSVVWQQITV